MPNATPIKRFCCEYSNGRSQKQHGLKCKVIQFPLTAAFALNGHKTQGMNVLSPRCLVADFPSGSWSCNGMVYVVLGRIQNMQQLYLKSFDPKKIMVSEVAEQQARKIEREALNNPRNRTDVWDSDNCFIRKIASLNIRYEQNNDTFILY